MRLRGLGLGVVVLVAAVAVPALTITPAGAASEPAAPPKPAAVSGNGEARVTWKAPANHGAAIGIYVVTPFTGGKAQPKRVFHSTALTHLVTGLKDGRTYVFKVAAHNAVGTGATSVASNPVLIGAPAAPSSLLVERGNAQARLQWKAPVSNGAAITIYVVTPFTGGVAQTKQVFHSTATSEVVTGLTNAHTYRFEVAAHNARGTGPISIASPAVAPTSAAALSAVMNASVGAKILVDSRGMTLYLYDHDGTSATSTVPPGILSIWPRSTWSGTVTVGTGLDGSKATAAVQPAGARQVRYNGHLLYTFYTDTRPGDATGQGVGGFYVVSPAGSEIL